MLTLAIFGLSFWEMCAIGAVIGIIWGALEVLANRQ